MKRSINIFLSILLISTYNLFSQESYYPYYHDIKLLDINYIHMSNNNYGFLNSFEFLGKLAGAEWYHYGRESLVYEQGLFFIGKINNEIYLSEAMWGSLYSPGPVLDNKAAMLIHPEDSLKYRVYKVSKKDKSSNIDIKEWPKEWGAPVTNNGEIKLHADQMLWSVYNGLDSNCSVPVRRTRRGYPAVPIEIHQNSFAYKSGFDNLEFLDDIIFFEYTIINKGKNIIDSAYVGLWTDIDFGNLRNYPAIDTSLQLGYCWNDNLYNYPDDNYDSSKIPAVGYVQLFGPSLYSAGDTAIFRGKKKENYKNLNITGFWGVMDDVYRDTSFYGPAYSRGTAWNIARGFDKFGRKIIDPTTGKKTSFRYSGDPVTNTGWLSNGQGIGGGAGFYIFSGPFNLAPNDTQWVMYALIAARGGDNLKSISELRRRADLLRQTKYFDLIKFNKVDTTESIEIPTPENFQLIQNYPNPFNSTTTIKYYLPYKTNVKIELFNVLGQRIAIMLDTEKEAGIYEINFSSANISSGIYAYRMSAKDFSATKKMVVLK